MSKSTNTNPNANGKRMNAFVTRDYKIGDEQRTDWMRVGSAFPHADGKGFRVVLSATPVDGVLVLREPEDEAG